MFLLFLLSFYGFNVPFFLSLSKTFDSELTQASEEFLNEAQINKITQFLRRVQGAHYPHHCLRELDDPKSFEQRSVASAVLLRYGVPLLQSKLFVYTVSIC